MSFIRTVLGDIDPASLGPCYAHEHIIIDPSHTTRLHPDFLLDNVDLAVKELLEFHAAGGRAMVDSMPWGGGRNVLKLAEISRRTGVHILCPTGLHLAKYYPPGHACFSLGPAELADVFIREIRDGIDAHDAYPSRSRTPHRAGLIKVASSLDGLTSHERKAFEAAAIASVQTGAPILTHTEQGSAAFEQIQLLTGYGVASGSIILSHTDRRPDVSYHRDILSTGVFVEYDSAFRWPKSQPNHTSQLIAELIGFVSQIMLGMDAARRAYWRSYGGSPGLTYLLRDFTSTLRTAGLDQASLDAIFIDNPARAYAMRSTPLT